MLMEGLVGITALIAACAMPPEDYVAINTEPEDRGRRASAAAPGLARDDARARPPSTARSRRTIAQLLGLDASEPPVASRGRQKIAPSSKRCALSNGALAALGYHVDPAAPHATTLSDADFARLGVQREGAAGAVAQAPTRSWRRAPAAACRSRSAWRASSAGCRA